MKKAFRTLVVEDEAISALIVETIVEDMGHQIIKTVASGEQAVTWRAMIMRSMWDTFLALSVGSTA